MSGIDHDSIRVGTIGFTFGIHPGEEVRVRVTGRGMVGDSDVITYETVGRTDGSYNSAMMTNDLMPETSEQTQARWRADGFTTIGTYPPFEQPEADPPIESRIMADGSVIETRLVNGQRIGRTITAARS